MEAMDETRASGRQARLGGSFFPACCDGSLGSGSEQQASPLKSKNLREAIKWRYRVCVWREPWTRCGENRPFVQKLCFCTSPGAQFQKRKALRPVGRRADMLVTENGSLNHFKDFIFAKTVIRMGCTIFRVVDL